MHHEIDRAIRQTETAMAALEELLPDSIDDAPESTRTVFNNALLNVAVNRIIAMEGVEVTAGILWRLTEVVATGRRPGACEPAELSRLDG